MARATIRNGAVIFARTDTRTREKTPGSQEALPLAGFATAAPKAEGDPSIVKSRAEGKMMALPLRAPN
jgi:hypothetical protein